MIVRGSHPDTRSSNFQPLYNYQAKCKVNDSFFQILECIIVSFIFNSPEYVCHNTVASFFKLAIFLELIGINNVDFLAFPPLSTHHGRDTCLTN